MSQCNGQLHVTEHLPLSERERAAFGPRPDKPPGSVGWCWQTIFLMQSRWQQKTIDEAGYDALVAELSAYKAWEVVPSDKPYGSLDALLTAELGVTAAPPGPDVRTMTQQVAELYQGARATLAYRWFAAINTHLFADQLPLPLILWNITPHGRCLGKTRSAVDTGIPPMIQLHPSLLGGTEKKDPWGVSGAWLGPRYALDVLIHECIHVAVHYVLGWRQTNKNQTSHDNDAWIAEVNRLAPLLGFADVRMARNKPTRTGKTVARTTTGTVPYAVATTFPYSVRLHHGTAASYYPDATAKPFTGIEV